MNRISSYHAHVYFTEESLEQARAFCEKARDVFSVQVGRFHKQPIGPHPMPSCQLSFDQGVFAELVPWMMENRDGLTIFVHGLSGDDIRDHTDYAFWMGSMEKLNMAAFN